MASAEKVDADEVLPLPCLKMSGKGSSREEPEIGTEVVMRNALLFFFAVQEKWKTPLRKNPQTSDPLRCTKRYK